MTTPILAIHPVTNTYLIAVLLVDDQKIVAEAVRRILADQPDIVFHSCTEATKAVQMAAKIKPTVILLDLIMPGCDGLVLVKEFKANFHTKDIPIIILSAMEDPQLKVNAFSIGVNDYVVKLPNKLELIARIRYHSESYIRLLERNEAYKILQKNQALLLGEYAEAAAYVKSLLPAPLHGEIKTSWRFIPSEQLGGDAFGYHWLDNDQFAFYLLDVCGHGVGAALLSVSILDAVEGETLPDTDFFDPKSVMRGLNNAFQMEAHNNMFFTIWYGVYNKKTEEITYSNAGHPPAILVTGPSSDKVKVLDLRTFDIVIGAVPDAEFHNFSCKVESYNKLTLFSDGVYEIIKPDGTVLGLPDFIKVLTAPDQAFPFDLDRIVSVTRELQGKIAFVDDFSILQIIFRVDSITK